ncbi:hypothetical protein F5J12DRAFT_786315 [Pisolithus orientalis]|uniref:uncharacterized protein n=1 Tax=Pisolithus orientalis TaxID=936130 RepID=UPI0022242C6D|nr:uncharacterized protein F5J12DRAFT_786315 [Pisolithus orientalis]KAI5991669.1 hypothetical protein F5J12DRAFT_786315 [Pisolithus orientalis]
MSDEVKDTDWHDKIDPDQAWRGSGSQFTNKAVGGTLYEGDVEKEAETGDLLSQQITMQSLPDALIYVQSWPGNNSTRFVGAMFTVAAGATCGLPKSWSDLLGHPEITITLANLSCSHASAYTDNQGYRGSAVLSPDKTHILISNLMTGLDLYPVVSGATDGVMVQVLCSFQGRNYNFLATYATGHGMCMTIKLWKAKTDTEIECAFGQLFNLDEADHPRTIKIVVITFILVLALKGTWALVLSLTPITLIWV